jgi:hypothetical protein
LKKAIRGGGRWSWVIRFMKSEWLTDGKAELISTCVTTISSFDRAEASMASVMRVETRSVPFG